MDPETHLDPLSEAALYFSKVKADASPKDAAMQRISRQLLGADPLERLIPEKLLYEAVETLLRHRVMGEAPLVVFMNRGGLGDGARATFGLTALLAKHLKNPSLLHVSFNTPFSGLGALVRSAVAKSASDWGIEARVSVHNLPAERLSTDEADADAMIGRARLVISYASSGASGLIPQDKISAPDHLLQRSHTAVLSFPDPEGLPGELTRLEALIGREPNFTGLRFWVQLVEEGHIEDLGFAMLGRNGDGDAHQRLWQLIENARRRPYRVLVEPMADGIVTGYPLVCPCRSLLTDHNFVPSVRVLKVVPVGSRLAVTAQGIGVSGV